MKKNQTLSVEDRIWNEFVSLVTNNEIFDLSAAQQIPAMVFWYCCALSNGGHSAFFDDYPEIDSQKLVDALNAIGAQNYAENFMEALEFGEQDDYRKTDDYFGNGFPSLDYKLIDYVTANKEALGLTVK